MSGGRPDVKSHAIVQRCPDKTAPIVTCGCVTVFCEPQGYTRFRGRINILAPVKFARFPRNPAKLPSLEAPDAEATFRYKSLWLQAPATNIPKPPGISRGGARYGHKHNAHSNASIFHRATTFPGNTATNIFAAENGSVDVERG